MTKPPHLSHHKSVYDSTPVSCHLPFVHTENKAGAVLNGHGGIPESRHRMAIRQRLESLRPIHSTRWTRKDRGAERGECGEMDEGWLEVEDLEKVAAGLLLDF